MMSESTHFHRITKICPWLNSWNLWMWLFFWREGEWVFFTTVIKLRFFRWDHPHHFWVQMGSKFNNKCSLKRYIEGTHRREAGLQSWLYTNNFRHSLETRREMWNWSSLRAPEETDTTVTLISDFKISEWWENNFCCFKPLNLWSHVMTATTNEYRTYSKSRKSRIQFFLPKHFCGIDSYSSILYIDLGEIWATVSSKSHCMRTSSLWVLVQFHFG